MKSIGGILIWAVLTSLPSARSSLCPLHSECSGIRVENYCNYDKKINKSGHLAFDPPVCTTVEDPAGLHPHVYLHCCVRGAYTKVTWEFIKDVESSAGPMSPITGVTYRNANQTVDIHLINSEQYGQYTCTAENEKGIKILQTIKVVVINCKQHERPVVIFPEDKVVYEGETSVNLFHIDFGCGAQRRTYKFTFDNPDGRQRTSDIHIDDEECIKAMNTSQRRCGGKISVRNVTKAVMDTVISLTVEACYGTQAQTVQNKFRFLNAMRCEVMSNNTEALVTCLLCMLAVLALVCVFVWMKIQKIHVWLWSRFPVDLIGRNVSGGQLYLYHSDEDIHLAHIVKRWIKNKHGSLGVTTSEDLTGKGYYTGEDDIIKKSDFIFVIPYCRVNEAESLQNNGKAFSQKKLHENVFHSIIEHKKYNRITILDTDAKMKIPCSLIKNKIYKNLKHINIKSGSYQDVSCSALRHRLPVVTMRRRASSFDLSTDNNNSVESELHAVPKGSFTIDEFYSQMACDLSAPRTVTNNGQNSDSKTITQYAPLQCSDTESSTEEHIPDIGGSRNLSCVDTATSVLPHGHGLTLNVHEGSCGDQEVTSYDVISPDSTTTYWSPDVLSNRHGLTLNVRTGCSRNQEVTSYDVISPGTAMTYLSPDVFPNRHGLTLNVRTGSSRNQEVTSYGVIAPDTAMMYLSPDVQYHSDGPFFQNTI